MPGGTTLRQWSLRQWCVCGFTYFGLAYYSQGVIAAIQAASGDVARTTAGETNLSSTLAQSAILAGLFVAVSRRPTFYLRSWRPLLPILCIVALAILSAAWSADPVRTLRRSAALAECMLFGVFLHRTASLDHTIARIGRVCVAMAVLSLLAYVAMPSIGHERALGYEQALRGVFPQKNSMAECMLLGLCCYAYRWTGESFWPPLGAAAVLGSCLLLGRGASAIGVAGAVGLWVGWSRLRGRTVLRVGVAFAVGWCVTVVAVALLAFPGELFALIGRDPSLTGRVPLWQALMPEIARAPWLGHGYAAFWNADSATVQMIWRYAGWSAPDAHSSYLDILLQLGMVGGALYAWAGMRLWRLIRSAGRTGLAPSGFATIYGTALLLLGGDEGIILIPNIWLLLVPGLLLSFSRHPERSLEPERSSRPAMAAGYGLTDLAR